MERELIEIKSKLQIASKYIRKHNDSLAADQVIEFCMADIDRIFESIKYCYLCGEPITKKHKTWCKHYPSNVC